MAAEKENEEVKKEVKKTKKTQKKANSKLGKKLGKKLDPKRRKFIKYFTTVGSETEGQVAQSLIKAGFSEKTAAKAGWSIRYEPLVAEEIKRIQEQQIDPKLDDAVTSCIDKLIKIINADPSELYEIAEYTTEDGETKEYEKAKLFRDIPKEIRVLLDGKDYKGKNGAPDFVKINKIDAMKLLLTFLDKRNARKDRQAESQKNPTQSIEVAFDAIQQKVEAKIKLIQKSDEEALDAGSYYDEPSNLLEED